MSVMGIPPFDEGPGGSLRRGADPPDEVVSVIGTAARHEVLEGVG